MKLVDAINRTAPTWRLRGFIDDRPERRATSVLGYPILGDRSILAELAAQGAAFFSNVSGKVSGAMSIAALLDEVGSTSVSLVHPAIDMAYVEIGHGCILPEGCVVGTGTRIGNHMVARLHVVISHDVCIEDFVFIGPGTVLGGHCHIESGAFLGAGVAVMTGCNVGRHSVIGAGALVAEHIPPNVTIGGLPGRMIKSNGRE